LTTSSANVDRLLNFFHYPIPEETVYVTVAGPFISH